MLDTAVQQTQINPFGNQAVGSHAAGGIAQAIKLASAHTGVDFAYLLNKANVESSLNPNAKASTSSATGLFQFVEQTWLRMVKTYGDKFGLGDYASRIQIDSSGVAHVNDSKTRHTILALRKDPQISADMAGELANENRASLKANVGGKIGPTELYLAHFLGAGGAGDFLKAMRANPAAAAADVLPEAAAANANVFYDKAGQARSLSQIYKHFAQKFNHAPTIPADAATMVAGNTHAPAGGMLVPPVSSYNVASLTAPASSVGTYVPNMMLPASGFVSSSSDLSSSLNGMQANSSALFAAMLLAQTGFGHAEMAALNGDLDKSDDKKATAASIPFSA